MGGFGGLGAPLGLSGATFCSPGEQKESQKCSKDDLGDMLKPSISYVFLYVFEVRGPPGDPNDGLEAVSNPTWSSCGALLKDLWSIMAHSVALECQECSPFLGGGGWRWVEVWVWEHGDGCMGGAAPK